MDTVTFGNNNVYDKNSEEFNFEKKVIPVEEETIQQTLNERGSKYGPFIDHATVTVGMKDVTKLGRSYCTLDPDMIEAIDMICHKIGRIVCGDPYHRDNWHDIAGYAKLVDDRLKEEGH